MTRSARLLLALSFATATASPGFAQFLISVQQNGQAVGVANGGTITVNAPAVGQTATATVTLTNLTTPTVSFAAAPQILGSGDFTADATPVSVTSLSSTTFHILFNPTSSAQDVSQFIWTFTEPGSSSTSPATPGVINFTLVGTAPNLIVNTVQTNGNSVAVPTGGTIQFPSTPVGSTSSQTLAISNTGSGFSAINSITASGSPFTLQGVPLLPLTLNAGSQLQFTAQFLPTSLGPQTGSLQISLGTGSYTASLAGTGTGGLLTYQITQDGKTSPLSPSQTITMDSTDVGSTSSVVIQFQNAGTTAVTLSTIGTSGTAFVLSDGPFLPITLQPQQVNTVTLTFTPTQPGPTTGRLLIGSDTFPLTGIGLGPLLQYSYQVSGGSSVSVTAGNLISFSPIAVGQTESLVFTITNTGTAATAIQSLGVADTTGVFKVVNLSLPVQLAASASASFTLSFTPVTPGLVTSTLVVNNQTFAIGGFANAPPALPAYQFTGASGTQQPFTQPAIGLSLAAPYAIALTGTLSISSSFALDPAVQFSTGGTKVTFTIPANALQAIFPGGSTTIQLQTGTVAGTIMIQPDFTLAGGFDVTPTNPTSLEFTVPSQAPTILTASISNTSDTGFSVVITGFTTTRYLDHVTFQFTAASAFALSSTNVTVDVSGAAKLWFLGATSQAEGGQFNLTIPFALAGGSTGTNLVNSIGAISIVVVNDIGSSAAVVVHP
jgi:hypothetical protein